MHILEEPLKSHETYRALLPEAFARISPQLCLWCCRSGKERSGRQRPGLVAAADEMESGPGLGDRDVGGKPSSESSTSSSVVELGLGFVRISNAFSNR